MEEVCPLRFRALIVLRQWDHFVVGAAAASEHREIVIG
jgi:hypothetical protein